MSLSHHGHHHHHTEAPVDDTPEAQDRYQQTKKVTLVGALTNLLLSVIKIVFGYISQSQALIADGIHSLSDLISDGLVLIAAKHTSREADANHPYGHGRIETVITVVLGLLLIVVAVGLAVDAVQRIMEPESLLHPSYLAIIIAAISIAANEFLYRYTIRVADKFRSNILRANAWHHRSDAISSLIVLIGVGGTILGIEYLDAVAAIGVALIIIKIGWSFSLQSIRELVDTGLEPETVETINETILKVDGVKQLHSLRSRRMGGDALVDVHILVPPKLSVSEGHFIGEKVREQLIKHVDEVTDVMVHIDPEDDETVVHSEGLPQREEIIQALHQHWDPLIKPTDIKNITLHYLDGKIHVELTLPLGSIKTPEQGTLLVEQLTSTAKENQYVDGVKVLFQ